MADEYSSTSPNDSCQSLWRRFIGMYGADSVQRRYGAKVPEEWRALVNRMNHYQLERGMRRLLHGGRAHMPSLPEFVKLCKDPGGTGEFEEGVERPLIAAPSEHMDAWLIEGNRHLLNHAWRVTAKAPKRYGNERATEWLVAFKNAWVVDMQAAAADGTVPEDHGRAWWQDCMRRAEEGIDSGREAQHRAAA